MLRNLNTGQGSMLQGVNNRSTPPTFTVCQLPMNTAVESRAATAHTQRTRKHPWLLALNSNMACTAIEARSSCDKSKANCTQRQPSRAAAAAAQLTASTPWGATDDTATQLTGYCCLMNVSTSADKEGLPKVAADDNTSSEHKEGAHHCSQGRQRPSVNVQGVQ
jgi:hypothetical protein